jgi:membrane protein involved in colicin uptake
VQREAEEERQRVLAEQEAAQRAAEAQRMQEVKAAEDAKAAVEARRQAAREKIQRARSIAARTEDPATPQDTLPLAKGSGQAGENEVIGAPPSEPGDTDREGEGSSKVAGGEIADRRSSGTVGPEWNPGQRVYPVTEAPRKKRPKPTRKIAPKAAGKVGRKAGGSQGGSSSALMVRCSFFAFRPV